MTNDLFGVDDFSFAQSSAPGPAAQIDVLVSTVDALASAGAIDRGPANSLARMLDAARAQVDRRPRAAAGILAAFVAHVTALVRAGALDVAQAQALVAAAQSAISALLAA